MNKIYYTFLACFLCLALLAGCKHKEAVAEERNSAPEEDLGAKRNLQGIWLDKETENVLLRIKGDSIYYPDTMNLPVKFMICGDTLYLSGENVVTYPIDKMGQYIFNFHSATGEIIRLIRSENPDDTLLFIHKQPKPLTYTEVVKKDTVVMYDNKRYHCYVYVNPTRQKVYKTCYTDEGIAVDNVYYDNVIHICVYQGKNCLFSRDYNKKSFAGVVPDDFLTQAILSNMMFCKADAEGCHFYATVCIPDDSSSYTVNICVEYNGHVKMSLLEH